MWLVVVVRHRLSFRETRSPSSFDALERARESRRGENALVKISVPVVSENAKKLMGVALAFLRRIVRKMYEISRHPERVGPVVGDEIRQRVSQAAERRHDPTGRATQPGRAASGHRSVVRKRFRKTHADAGADQGRETAEKGLPVLMGGQGAREKG